MLTFAALTLSTFLSVLGVAYVDQEINGPKKRGCGLVEMIGQHPAFEDDCPKEK